MSTVFDRSPGEAPAVVEASVAEACPDELCWDLLELGGSSLVGVGRMVDERIADLLAKEAKRWSTLGEEAAEPLSSLLRLVLAGGKRLRPAFCFWAFVGAGGSPDDERIVDVASALELVHCFALVHDDVMDASTHRRGMPAVHSDYEGRHAAAGWRGDSRRFGEGVALLVGDLAFIYADLLMGAANPEAAAVFTELRLEVTMGQYLDVVGSARRSGEAAAARTISLYKSAKYTVERPLHLGAALAGRLEETKETLSAFGLPLGEAFQLRDDLLGAFGDFRRTGKPVGMDLREGKATLLHAIAKERASGADLRFLVERYGAADLSDSEVVHLRSVLEETGARVAVEERIGRLVDTAVEVIDRSTLAAEARTALVDLAYFAALRDR